MKLSAAVLLGHSIAFSWAFQGPLLLSLRQSHHPALFGTSTSLRSASDDGNNDISVNPLVASVKVSKTVEVFSLVKEMEAEGETVTSLCVGEPDFLPPQAVMDAAQQALLDGKTRYTAVTGTVELRKAIAADLETRKGVKYNALTDIVVGNGAKQSVYQSVLATCGPGDKVLIPAPYWPSYPEMVALAGAEPVIVETKASDGFLLMPDALQAALKEHPETKLLIFCNPSNPTGGVHDKARLEDLASVLQEFPSVAVLADEIYERLVYTDDGVCPAFASMPSMYDRTLTVNGFSKAYAMTGMRLGYVAAPTKLAKAVTTIQSQLTSCAGSVSQAAGVAALTNVEESELEENNVMMKKKRDYVLGRLDQMPNVNVAVPPQGAFYVLPELSSYFDGDDTELCLKLLQSKKLALVPGTSFGAPGTVRISYATSLEELAVAMDKLESFLAEQQ